MRALMMAQLTLRTATTGSQKDSKRRMRYTRKRTFACGAISVASGQNLPRASAANAWLLRAELSVNWWGLQSNPTVLQDHSRHIRRGPRQALPFMQVPKIERFAPIALC